MNAIEFLPERIDTAPTRLLGGFQVRAGRPFPYGATLVPGGVNFSVYSDRATAMSLVLFRAGEAEPFAELEFPAEFRTGSVYAMTVFDLDYEQIEYGLRAAGPFDPERGDRFDAGRILSDPYARLISGRDVWRAEPRPDEVYPYRSRVLADDFDWAGDAPPRIPYEDLVIYETHVRGFTRHPTSRVTAPGTYAGLVEKIPYLRDLGVNCVELLPVFEFDERANPRVDPVRGESLHDFWGYNTVGFFAPKAGYAATGRLGMQADEFKHMVRELHRAGIEVVLDVVFNHTAEGDERGPTISFRGLDNATYYMLTPDGHYYNFSGTGNTVNCNHPVVREFVLDCLRYWVTEYHIDGFRFDLAAILDRAQDGTPLPNPPLLEQLAYDPILRSTKLIAEAWDAAGLYQVGQFPNYGRWSEWNGRYRDTLRRFLKGDAGTAGELATRLVGSPDLYTGRGATASINFVTAHDGFTLRDLVSYNGKHNEANGEDGRDGADDNNAWNCGHEGPTTEPEINALRLRQAKNAVTLLMMSQGVPMLLAGDELWRTQQGNNNTYCQDNELSWIDWSVLAGDAGLHGFVRTLISLRLAHPALRGAEHVHGLDRDDTGFPDVSWHGEQAWYPDWSEESRLVVMLRSARAEPGARERADHVYVAANAHWLGRTLHLPRLPAGLRWHLAVDTAAPSGADAYPPGREPPLRSQRAVEIGPRSALVLVGRGF